MRGGQARVQAGHAPAGPAVPPHAAPSMPAVLATAVVPPAKGSFRAQLVRQIDRVRWSVALIGLMTYIFVITSYAIPVGKLAIASALLSVLVQKGGVRIPTYLKWLAAFFVWVQVMARVVGMNEWISTGLSNLLTMTIIVFVAANAFRTRGQLRVFMLFFMACFVVFPMRGAVLNYFNKVTVDGARALWINTYNNPNDLAAMSLLQISMAASLLVVERKGLGRMYAMLHLFLMVLMILMTQSRGVFLGLIAFGAIAFFAHRNKVKFAMQGLAALMLLVAVTPPSAWKRLASLAASTESIEAIDGEEGSASERHEIWQVAKKIIREHPMTGVGLGAYKPSHQATAWGGEFNVISHGLRDTHSLYLNVIAETGYPGFAIYLGFLLSLLLHADRARRRLKRIDPSASRELLLLEAGALGFLGACTFGTLPYLPHFLLHLVMLHALADLRLQQAQAATGTPDAAPASAPARGRKRPGFLTRGLLRTA
jgi:O-antigen ligase